MNKKIILMLAMLFAVTTSWAQVNVEDDEIVEEDEITVTDQEGNEEVIEFPEAMTYDLDSLLNLYMSKTYLDEPDEDCNVRDINPTYSKEEYVDRLSRMPTVMEMAHKRWVS